LLHTNTTVETNTNMHAGRFFASWFRNDETLLKRRPWYFLAGALFLVSAFAHVPVVFLAGLFVLVIGLVPELWYRSALHHLTIRQHTSQHTLFFGEHVTLSLQVENRKVLPLPWLEVENEIPSFVTVLTGHASTSSKVNRSLLVSAFSLWSFQRVTRHFQLSCTARGTYSFGPVTVRCSDPFGWLIREEQMVANEMLFVYPLVAPLTAFGLPARHPFGEYATPRRLIEDPLRFAGIRDYMLGDDPRRIHWKATARAGILRSKIYEPSSQYRLLVVLDVNTYSASWMGVDPEIQELTISAAASIACWGLDEGYAVGLLTNSLLTSLADQKNDSSTRSTTTTMHTSVPRAQVPYASDRGQREHLLLSFARLIPYLGEPLDELLEEERDLLPREATVVLVSSIRALTSATIECLLDFQSQGVNIHLVLVGESEQNSELETDELPISYIGGREVWHELIKTHGGTGQSTTALHLD
jgi:uncharacterized protein (DUF58 family)